MPATIGIPRFRMPATIGIPRFRTPAAIGIPRFLKDTIQSPIVETRPRLMDAGSLPNSERRPGG